MKVMIADDHPLTLAGTKAFVEQLGYKVLHTCQNGIVALNILLTNDIDVALVDMNMPGINGLQVLKECQEKKCKTKIIFLTMHNEQAIYSAAMEHNAFAYLLKENAQDELAECLKAAAHNQEYKDARSKEFLYLDATTEANAVVLSNISIAEKRVLYLIAKQYKSKEIAEKLFISERTVEAHRRSIIEKLGLPKEKNVLLLWASKNSHLFDQL